MREQKKVGPKRLRGTRDSKDVWFGMSDSEGLIWDITIMRRPKASVRKANVGMRTGSGWSCLLQTVLTRIKTDER